MSEKERKDKEKAKEEELRSWKENGVFQEIDEKKRKNESYKHKMDND